MMRLTSITSVLGLACLLATNAFPQGGAQGPLQGRVDRTAQSIEQNISTYLNGEEVRSILTPGEFTEWSLNLKAGQVVFAEARSEAFDPAIEILNDKNKVLRDNDDRYPGDQRPLVLWRCEKDGTYALRVRCFHNKSGGQFFMRYKTYETIDLTSDAKVEKEMDARTPFLLRVPMKAGQVKDFVIETGGPKNYMPLVFNQVIFPSGLPERTPALSTPLSPSISALVAPIEGDYYLMETPYGRGGTRGLVSLRTRDIVPKAAALVGGRFVGKAPTGTPAMWELAVREGDLLEISTPDLNLDCRLQVAETPDFSKFDISKPESNPFWPQLTAQAVGESAVADVLPARARDGRVTVINVRRKTKLWIISNGAGPADKQFTLQVKPAASEFPEGKVNRGRLRIGSTDYWAIDAKAGDVMTLGMTASDFAAEISVYGPEMRQHRHSVALPDETSDKWRMIVQQPGRYLVGMAALGDGGGGEYTLSREVFHAQDFSMGKPAMAEISNGQVQIWKFTATPNNPLLVHWISSDWSYDVSIYDASGVPADFQRDQLDDHNRFGILKVQKPQTYVIVLSGTGKKATYSIHLDPVPGFNSPPQKSDSGK